MSSGSEKKKLIWLLVLQAWAILWVVIVHALLSEPSGASALDSAFYNVARGFAAFGFSFAMPLFIMISGYLFNMTRIEKNWKYGPMIKEKWLRLGIPYFGLITLVIIFKILLPGAVKRQVPVEIDGIILSYIDPYYGVSPGMWFIAVIFIYFLLYPLYPLVLKNYVTISITALISLVLYFIPVYLTHLFAIDFAAHFFIFFFIGLCISRLRLEKYLGKWSITIACGILYVIGFAYDIELLAAVSGPLAFWGLAVKIDRYFTDVLFKSFRNYTYQIFLIAIFVQIPVENLYEKYKFPASYPIFWIASILGAIFISVGIAKIAQKSNLKFLRRILGLKA